MAEAKPKLLIVEDDQGLQAQLKWAYDDFEVVIAGDRASAIAALRAEEPQVVTLDLGLPPDPDGTSEGFAVLDEIVALKPDTKVIVASGHGARESALTAIERGAYDFYQKPVDIEQLGLIVRRALNLHRIEAENRALSERAGQDNRVLGGLITAAPEMVRVARTIERVANTSVSVMLLGASGTGKELLARGLHEASARKTGSFVAINCAAIPENLLESELFGYEKGAFTGAAKQTMGKIETADGGTLFLDEVGDMPLALQAKLLRFLQDRKIERLGGRQEISVNVRIVCATNRDLQQMIRDQQFRQDLYFRIGEVTIDIPPLRDRRGAAAVLAHALIRKFGGPHGRARRGFNEGAIAALEAYAWPGNVRELENKVKSALIMSDGPLITAGDLGLDEGAQGGSLFNLREVRARAERQVITQVLAIADNNVSRAAELLGMTRPTLYDLMDRYGLRNAGQK